MLSAYPRFIKGSWIDENILFWHYFAQSNVEQVSEKTFLKKAWSFIRHKNVQKRADILCKFVKLFFMAQKFNKRVGMRAYCYVREELEPF